MIYPTITEYIEAIRFSEDNFDKLTNLVPVLKDNGEPYYSSGNFAVVFKMKDKESGKLHAVKCFLKDQEGREESYRKISNYLETIENRYLIKTKFLEKELFVDTKSTDQTEFPVVIMDWVEGVPLDVYIREKINDKMYLEYLCYTFSLMAQNLIEQEFAHGDLKPDNILVKEDGMLVLVDYDGMYVPEMFGERSRELGSPDFQHPDRKLIDFDKHLDDFSLASILLSLKLISIDPSLLDKFGDKDRLLFSQKDYREFPGSEINTEIFKHFENMEVLNIYHLFLQALGRKMCVWNNEMWKLEVPVTENKELFSVLLELSDFDDSSKVLLCDLVIRGVFTVDSVDSVNSFWLERHIKDYNIGVLFELAQDGNYLAQYCLGLCYDKGYVVEPDFDKAVKWYTKSANQGFALAQFNLSQCYYWGDTKSAKDHYVEEMLWRYGMSQDQRITTEEDVLKDYSGPFVNNDLFCHWLLLSANSGYSEAQFVLGESYWTGDRFKRDLDKAIFYYTKSAKLGNNKAQYKLALCYENGEGVIKSGLRATMWLKSSAILGNAEAQYKLGKRCSSRKPEAFEWFMKSAENGLAKAQFMVGVCYANGNGVAKDKDKAFEWFSKSADQKFPSAFYGLGFCYEKGYGVSVDLEIAVDLYVKAIANNVKVALDRLTSLADHGDSNAMYRLGDCYMNGIGVAVDKEKAVDCYLKSINDSRSYSMLMTLDGERLLCRRHKDLFNEHLDKQFGYHIYDY